MADPIQFYRDKDKIVINPPLFSTVAEGWAETIHAEGERSGDANKRSQLRKFYDEVLRLNAQIKANPTDWDNILPFVNMLIAKAVYAQGRRKVSDSFVKFIKDSVRQIEKKEDLEVFANFFESFMGFYRKYGAN